MKRKIDATDGTSYVYEFSDGKKVRITAGKDGVTEEIICQLKRMDNRAYEKDLNAVSRPMNKEERTQWDAEHPGETPRRQYFPSLDYEDVDGESYSEKLLYHQMVREEEVDGRVERLHELVDEMPAKRKEVLTLLLDGYSQTEIAEMLNLSKSTIRDHLNAAKKFIKKNF